MGTMMKKKHVAIIVAIVVLAAASAYLLLSPGKEEALEIVDAYVMLGPDKYTISFVVVNIGEIDATLMPDAFYLEGKDIAEYERVNRTSVLVDGARYEIGWSGVVLHPESEALITIEVPNTLFTSGTEVEIMIKSKAGNEYTATVEIP